VAIKVLPAAFTEDPDRLARFEREARVLAALEHPNIAGIYGLEEADGQRLLVMQLAAGETLSARLASGPMSLAEALPIALQIARALEAAHERGIVHRDLKPANVMLALGGAAERAVKVLDFGLAKAWEGGAAASSNPALTASPTLTARMTQAGVILGTAGYMSPEQARGQEADHRSDIWSFGVVLAEMLTGQRLFQADTVSDTLARVLLAEPDWETIDAELPAPIGRLLRRCLERDRERRLQAVGEARIVLEDCRAAPEGAVLGAAARPVHAAASVSATPEAESRRRASMRARLALGLAAGVAVGWLAATLLVPGRAGAPAAPLHFSVHPPKGAVFVTEDVSGVDISRDGSRIAFVAAAPEGPEPMIYVKRAGDAEARPVPGTEGARQPFFSPDGEWIGYFTDSEVRKISLSGGVSIPLAATQDRRGAVWHPDGTIYLVPHSSGPLMRVPDTGGEVTAVTRLDSGRNERTHRWPALLPDGKGILFTSDTFESTEYYDDARIEVVDLESGERKVVLEGSSRAVYSPTGHLLFARGGALYAASFDLAEREVTGGAHLAVQEVSTVVASGAAQFALSNDGSLAYIPGGKTTDVFDLVWLGSAGEEVVAAEIGQFFQAAPSPTGDRIVLTTSSHESRDLWMYDVERGSSSRFTFGGTNLDPVWTPDGGAVLFRAQSEGGGVSILRKSADGLGAVEVIYESGHGASPMDVTPDGRWLLVGARPEGDERAGPAPANQAWVVDLTAEREPYRLF
jgi:serine/threonine-protein kinase